jgi:hypothetical protein
MRSRSFGIAALCSAAFAAVGILAVDQTSLAGNIGPDSIPNLHELMAQ